MGRVTRHSKSRYELAQKGIKIDRLQNPYLEKDQLEEYGICASQIDLTDTARFPQYFLPATVERLASLADRRPELRAPPQPGEFEYEEEDECRAKSKYYQATYKGRVLEKQFVPSEWEGRNLLEDTAWEFVSKRRGCANRMCVSSSGEYPLEWRLRSLLETTYDSRPHLACMLHQGVENIGPLLKSEVLTAIGLIVDRMGTKRSKGHLIFPLQIVSMMGTQGRIVQAHYDGDKLYIQYSKLYELKNYDRENVDLFLRWMMSEPIGDTALVVPDEEDDMGAIHKGPLKEVGNPLQGEHPEILLAA